MTIDSTTTASASRSSMGKPKRRTVAALLGVLAFALVGARIALWTSEPVAETMLWGAVVGCFLTCGERRTEPRRRLDRSGVIGSTVDSPPAHTIIQP